MKDYYDARAPEYDDWYEGRGLFAARDRPAWSQELVALTGAIVALPPARTLDVACGTGYLTRHLRGEVTAVDHSPRMVAIARRRLPRATVYQADAMNLPFHDGAFQRLFTGHFYGHLTAGERARFVTEARRVATELVVVDSARRDDHEREEVQQRVLNDGSRYAVYKRYFDPDDLAVELGGAEVLHRGRWFVMVATNSAKD